MKKFVYIQKEETDIENVYKIGVTNNLTVRNKQFLTGNSNDILIVKSFLSNYPYKIEAALLKKYKHKNKNRDWFYLDDDDLNEFEKNCELYEKIFKNIEHVEIENKLMKEKL